MLTRRATLGALAAAAAAPAPVLAGPRYDVAVVGAGVFGAWTAEHLRRAGRRVLLIDAWSPAHAAASSGGESRMTRAAYGADELYAKMALASLAEWKRLSTRGGAALFHEIGVLFFASERSGLVDDTLATHARMGLKSELLDRAAMQVRFPQIAFDGVEAGVFEPRFGALMARRAVQTLVAEYLRQGGNYLKARVEPPTGDTLSELATTAGRIAADRFVFAAGAWLPKLFPAELGGRIFPTRQEVFFFASPPGDDRFGPSRLPGWADWNGGDIWYGFPDLEGRGFKIAHDAHGPAADPDTLDRVPSARGLAEARAVLARRFPALAAAPLVEARVCQYENSANGDFLIDNHPRFANAVLAGAGSGHGFKHGPEVGRLAAALALGGVRIAEPRFTLASKGEVQARAVH